MCRPKFLVVIRDFEQTPKCSGQFEFQLGTLQNRRVYSSQLVVGCFLAQEPDVRFGPAAGSAGADGRPRAEIRQAVSRRGTSLSTRNLGYRNQFVFQHNQVFSGSKAHRVHHRPGQETTTHFG